MVISGIFPHLEEGEGLDVGKAVVEELISRHGGIVGNNVRGNTDMLIMGHLPGQTKVHDAEKHSIKILDLDTLGQLLVGSMSFQEFVQTSPQVISMKKGE